MKLLKILNVIFFLAAFQINAQQAVVSSGANATGSNGNVSYTVGQLIYTTNFSATGSISQGVQQAYEIQTVMGLDNFDINLEFVVYPNPTADWLAIDIKNYNYETLRYQLFDINGRLVLSDKIVSDSTILKMQELSTSMYLLKVLSNNKEVKTFKIFKK